MPQYQIYFEFYGRKMKTKLYADEKSQVKQILARKIEIIEVNEIKDERNVLDGDDDVLDFLNAFYKIKKK